MSRPVLEWPHKLALLAVVALLIVSVWREKLALEADLAVLRNSAQGPLRAFDDQPIHFTGILRAKDGTGYTLFESACPAVVVFYEPGGTIRTLVLQPIAPVDSNY